MKSEKDDRGPEISIIIPVFHETALICETLEAITALNASRTAEVIVVDGTPDGSTISRLGGYAVETISSHRGRSLQMNAGARRARGEILLFLHADTRLPQDALQLIKSRLSRPEIAAGAFDLGIDSKKPVFRIIEKMANRRSRFTRIPYGDQAIFIKKGVFHALGGYAPIAIMEDIELMRRVKKTGGKITLIGEKIWTSPRRWEQEGIVSCTLRNWLLAGAFYLGVSPEKLKPFYP